MKTKKRILGDKGERIASKYLKKRGYKILERNYLEKCGELDVIALQNNILHFIEVKTVSRITNPFFSRETCDCVIHETCEHYKPEDNVSFSKLKRLERVIQVYLSKNRLLEIDDYQLDVISVILYKKGKPHISHIENVS